MVEYEFDHLQLFTCDGALSDFSVCISRASLLYKVNEIQVEVICQGHHRKPSLSHFSQDSIEAAKISLL